MVSIVPLVGPLAFGIVFERFSYDCVKCSHGFNRLPRWSIGFLDRTRMVFLWFRKKFAWF